MSKGRTHKLAFHAIAFLVLTLLIAGSSSAQDKPYGRVSGFPVKVEGGPSRVDQATKAMLDDRITVVIEVIPGKPATGTQANNPAAAPEEQSWIPGIALGDIGKLVPYLDGRPLAGVYPESVDSNDHTLTFHLERTEESEKAWSDLLSSPGFKPRPLPFSVGLEGKEALKTTATLNLVVIQVKWFLIAATLFLIVLYVFCRLASRTSLIRDGGVSASPMPKFRSLLWGKRPTDLKLPPFSLARSQMAFWFFMVIASFIFIWMTTGGTSVSSSVLVLIGISAGTALGATAIDSGRPDEPAQESNGFLNDILSEGKGITFHRFQIVVWTLVLGIVFFRSLITSLTMMDFSTNLLTLMGISSGTYLGMKLPTSATAAASEQPQGNAGGGGAAAGTAAAAGSAAAAGGGAAGGGGAADQ